MGVGVEGGGGGDYLSDERARVHKNSRVLRGLASRGVVMVMGGRRGEWGGGDNLSDERARMPGNRLVGSVLLYMEERKNREALCVVEKWWVERRWVERVG